MTDSVDRRGQLDEQSFYYQLTKGGRVFISWNHKQVSVLNGPDAAKLITLLLRLVNKVTTQISNWPWRKLLEISSAATNVRSSGLYLIGQSGGVTIAKNTGN
jgi:hypothetical protein